MSKPKSFVLYNDYALHVSRLNDEDAGQLFKAIFNFVELGEVDTISPAADMCLSFIIEQIKRDREKYEMTCQRRSENGKKGGRAKAKKANGFSEKQTETKKADTDNYTENKTDNYNNTVTEMNKTKRFTPPTLEEVKAYCAERNNGIDPQRFIDYYTSNGWKVGRTSMRDWKAALRTWEQRDKQENKPAARPQQPEYEDFFELLEKGEI